MNEIESRTKLGEDRVAAARELLRWYTSKARFLPWRETDDPWAIWVSEVMLQQTRVETVLPRYGIFLERFPTLHELADATEDEVLAAWSGLGYYRRARSLWKGAREARDRGGVPRSAEELKKISGIGSYTAAAIASIAFGEVVPVLDGNVERFLTRQLALEGDPKRAAVRKALLAEAGRWLDEDRPGDSNQALMELGATICRPRDPACDRCPVASRCRARRLGEVDRFPSKGRKSPTVEIRGSAAIVKREGRVLLSRRPRDAKVLAGTWELPWVEDPSPGSIASDSTAVEEALGSKYGGTWRVGDPERSARHAITFRRLHFVAYRATVEGIDGGESSTELGWFDAEERSHLATSSLVGKLLDEVREF